MKDPKATLKIFSTGSITVTAPRVQNVQAAIEKIFYMVYEFQKPKSAYEQEKLLAKQKKSQEKWVHFLFIQCRLENNCVSNRWNLTGLFL